MNRAEVEELLDEASPGPWTRHGWDIECPDGGVIGATPPRSMNRRSPGNRRLIAAAPEIAAWAIEQHDRVLIWRALAVQLEDAKDVAEAVIARLEALCDQIERGDLRWTQSATQKGSPVLGYIRDALADPKGCEQ